MSKKIVIKIEGSASGTDAPTVDDLLAQLRDTFDLLDIVEETVAADGQNAIDWRVTNASKSSPLSFTIEPFARQFAVNIDNRANAITGYVMEGLNTLKSTSARPKYFNDEALVRSERLFERITNGLARTDIIVDSEPVISLTPAVARIAAKNTLTFLRPDYRPYREVGSVEGYFESVSLDGYGRRVLHMKHRITGEGVKCIVSGDAEREIGLQEIGEVWKKRRISVSGTIHYKAPGRISQVDAISVRFLRSHQELPDIDDIIDRDFTGGMRSEDYLDKLRNGET